MSDRPRRREFLTQSATLAAAALGSISVLGCKEDGDTKTSSDEGTSSAAGGEDKAKDAKLLTEAVLLEETAVKVYTAAAGLPFIKSDAVVLQTAARFMGQHKEHSARLAAVVKKLTGDEVDTSKVTLPELPKEIGDESLDDAARKTAVLRFARNFEMGAAQKYYKLVTTELTTALARKEIADIMPVEAQHVAVYDFVLGESAPSPTAFLTEQS